MTSQLRQTPQVHISDGRGARSILGLLLRDIIKWDEVEIIGNYGMYIRRNSGLAIKITMNPLLFSFYFCTDLFFCAAFFPMSIHGET